MSAGDQQGPATQDLGGKRRADSVCDRFEAAWKVAAPAGTRPCIEDYLAETGELKRSALLRELIPLDAVYRRLAGEDPQPQDYQGCFPGLDPAWLEQILQPQLLLPSGGTPPTSRGESTGSPAGEGASAPGGPAVWPVLPGYEILDELCRGGMGVVYRAWQEGLRRIVAVKMVLAGEHASAQAVARLRVEAEVVARFQHPNIVQIYEVGEHQGLPYFALEYVDGGSLARQLDGRPTPARPAAQLVETLARAMHYAHERGIVHRDLKPANILLARGDPIHGVAFGRGPDQSGPYEPKITDFSLAKLLIGRGAIQTESGAVMGTPSYMAPEQATGKAKQVGPAADVYALGAILYELVSGRPPFRGETPLDTLQQVVSHEPVPPRRLQPNLPRDLETICLKCLQKESRKRYTSAEMLAEDIHEFNIVGDKLIESGSNSKDFNSVPAGTMFYMPMFNADDSPIIVGTFPTTPSSAVPYFFDPKQIGLQPLTVVVDGKVTSVGPAYLAGPVEPDPLQPLNDGGGTHIITLGVFLTPLSVGSHTVQFSFVASGDLLEPYFNEVFGSPVNVVTWMGDFTYTVNVVPAD